MPLLGNGYRSGSSWLKIIIYSNHYIPIFSYPHVFKSSLPHLINPFPAQAGGGGGGPKIEPTDDKWADLGAGAALLMGNKVISARRPASSPTFTLFARTGCFSQ